MPRPLRLFEPDGVYFITGRCLQARFLMRPSAVTNSLIAGVFAHAVATFDVDVFAFVFASNHFHLLVRSHACRIPAFMQYLRSNIAKKLGRCVDWRGKFWDRRYDAEPVLDDDALVDRLRYVLAHGVKEGLVARVADWPGLTSLPELLNAAPRAFEWPGSHATAGTVLRVVPLPCWEAMSADVRKRLVLDMLVDIEDSARAGRRGARVLGARAILAQDPHAKPNNIKRSPRPVCHATSRAVREQYAAKYRTFAEVYAEASARYRRGDRDVEFPLFAHPPPWVVPQRLAA